MKNYFKFTSPVGEGHFVPFDDRSPEGIEEAWQQVCEYAESHTTTRKRPSISVWQHTASLLMTEGPWLDLPAICGKYEPEKPNFKPLLKKPSVLDAGSQ